MSELENMTLLELRNFAKEQNMTLVGFIRKNSGNIYHEGNVKLNEQSR